MPIPKLNFTVSEAQTKAFANAWDSGGIKIILDNTSIKFATDWANIALKSFVAEIAQDMAKRVAEKKAANPVNAVSTTHIPVDAPPVKGKIILTD